MFNSVDYEAFCLSCNEKNAISCIAGGGVVSVFHALHRGGISFLIRDLICEACQQVLQYDGKKHVLDIMNRKSLFTRELLDSWIWDSCGRGETFRDCLFAWSSRASSTTSTVQLLAKHTTLNRQTANDTFWKFLMILRLPKMMTNANYFPALNVRGEQSQAQKEWTQW